MVESFVLLDRSALFSGVTLPFNKPIRSFGGLSWRVSCLFLSLNRISTCMHQETSLILSLNTWSPLDLELSGTLVAYRGSHFSPLRWIILENSWLVFICDLHIYTIARRNNARDHLQIHHPLLIWHILPEFPGLIRRKMAELPDRRAILSTLEISLKPSSKIIRTTCKK